LELVIDHGTHFFNAYWTIDQKNLIKHQKLKHQKITPYHLQAKGQTKKKRVLMCNFDKKWNGSWFWLGHKIIWSYQIAYKITTSHTPFQLVYGQEVILPIELELLSFWIALNEKLPLDD
jgi:hypothetical protein